MSITRTIGLHAQIKMEQINSFHKKHSESVHAHTEHDIDKMLVDQLEDALYAVFAYQSGKFPYEINILNHSKYDKNGKRMGDAVIQVVIGDVDYADNQDDFDEFDSDELSLLSTKLQHDYQIPASALIQNFSKLLIDKEKDIKLIEDAMRQEMSEPENITSLLTEIVYHVLNAIHHSFIGEEFHDDGE